jgi:hypothetical protein
VTEYGRQRARAKYLYQKWRWTPSPAHTKASDKQILDKTRDIIKDTFRDEVGAKFASIIANGIRLEHINEYKDTVQQARANPLRNIHPPALPPPHPGAK